MNTNDFTGAKEHDSIYFVFKRLKGTGHFAKCFRPKRIKMKNGLERYKNGRHVNLGK
jgi:hypothetical protein